jgi:anaerobic magnesium-protoporphyrin IX monomethyl ester cyclase
MSQCVSLINPPSPAGKLANREGAAGLGVVTEAAQGFFYPPHTLASAASVLRAAGVQVQAFDGLVQDPSSSWGEADVVGVFVSYASLDSDLKYLRALGQIAAGRVVVFGPAVRFVFDRLLETPGIDAVLWGDAEGFFPEAVQRVGDLSACTSPVVLTAQDVGAAGYDEHGWLQDLDSLPFPGWDSLPYASYALLTVMSSRGCPELCAYCPYAAAQGHRFRSHSVDRVLAELEHLATSYSPARVVFRDPVFAWDRERVVDLCTGMLDRGLRVNWECESRPEHFDVELLRLMKRAGCRWVKIGLETTDAQVLVDVARVASLDAARLYLEQVVRVVKSCRRLGLACRLFVMAGLPGQDVRGAKDTARFVEELRPAAVNVKILEPYPGTSLPERGVYDVNDQLRVLEQARQTVQAGVGAGSWRTRAMTWLRRIAAGDSFE